MAPVEKAEAGPKRWEKVGWWIQKVRPQVFKNCQSRLGSNPSKRGEGTSKFGGDRVRNLKKAAVNGGRVKKGLDVLTQGKGKGKIQRIRTKHQRRGRKGKKMCHGQHGGWE